MGVADGPAYAEPKPGSKPIISEPCQCPECVAGPGIEHPTRSIGELVKITTNRWCATCGRTGVVTSMRNGDGSWTNVCEELHVWKVHR